MNPIDCVIATYDGMPDLDPDDRLLLGALREHGVTVAIGVWSDPTVEWSAARLCVLRSTWDYPKHFARFSAWLDAVEQTTVIRNEPALVRWNSHKQYLRELELAGIPIVPTAWLARRQRADLRSLLAAHGWEEAVVKPARGAAALHVLRVSLDRLDDAQAHLDRLLRTQDVLVQQYIDTAVHAERSLVFIAGAFTHAVSKRPFDTKMAIGDAAAQVVTPTADERAVAARAIASVPAASVLYGRVDVFQNDDGHVLVNEIELIEPALYLGAHPPAAQRLAAAIAHELASMRADAPRRLPR